VKESAVTPKHIREDNIEMDYKTNGMEDCRMG
jgi:hypothetical protein